MSGAVPQGRARSLRAQLRFQVLRVSFDISVDDPAVERELRFLAQSAIQPEPARLTMRYEVRRQNDGYEIWRNGVFQDLEFDPIIVLQDLYARIQRDALTAWPDAVLLRTLTGRRDNQRFILVGETLWDRSRIGLELIRGGCDLEGDDFAILHDGVLTAYPRPLRVCGEDAPLPARAPPRAELPFLGSSPTTGSWALDLAEAGVEWRISTGPVQAVILLETNYGGQTRIYEVARHETARVLMAHCQTMGGKADAIRAVAQLVNGARCHRMRLGSLDDVIDAWPVLPCGRLGSLEADPEG